MKFTIFTPTYNRAHTLPRLYESLKKQSNKDFEWLVVDDGSTDNTEELIQKYIGENPFPIQYHKQENQGKHIAINSSLELAKGEYWITIDSDDYITGDCIEVCHSLAQKIDNKPDFASFTFIRFSEETPYDKSKYGKKEWTKPSDYQWEFHGEMNFTFKTAIAKKHPFPVYKGEKFCRESVFLIPILSKYKVLCTDNVLSFGDYLEDGLSQNTYKRMLESPHYAMLYYRKKLDTASNHTEKLNFTQYYWDIANKTGGGIIKNITKLPIYWTILVFIRKFLSKLKMHF
ncbi:MAG: glycosyltransferase family A protein [Flavobacteriaceae bacterium]|nr:glycosyltransferase family A protein [Flavobacteriaceae bacterium]